MTTPAYASSNVTAGIGKESTYGTGVSPTYYLPWKTLDVMDIASIDNDAAWRGAPGDGWGFVPGATSSTLKLGDHVYPDLIGFPLAGLLGDVVAAGSGPTTWTMGVLNTGTQQPASYTLTTSDGVNSRRWAGMKFATLTLTSTPTGSLTWTADAVSLLSTTTTAPSVSYTTTKIQPGWIGAITIGGSLAPTVIDCTVKITRAVTPKRNNNGAQAPYLQRSGVCAVSGTMTLVMTTDTYRSQYVAGTTSSLKMNWAQGAGASATQIQINCSRIAWQQVTPVYSSAQYQEVRLDWQARYNTTDVGASGGTGPCLVTLKNAVTSGVY